MLESFETGKIDGTTPSGSEHLLLQSRNAAAPAATSTVYKEAAKPIKQKFVTLRKEMLVSSNTDVAPMTPTLTDFDAPLVPVQT